jgi:hypothetical protein
LSISINVNTIHDPHPQLRAEDWRSPLIRRLLGCDTYQDGTAEVSGSFIGQNDSLPTTQSLTVAWTGLATDFNKVVKTYQAPVITEFATLGLACGMVAGLAGLEITEVTLRGDRADYWLGDKDLMLEVSGQESGDLATLCDEKSEQLANNPYGKDGYVCVANYSAAEARLWFFTAVLEEEDEDV